MLKNIVALAIACTLMLTVVLPASASSKAEKQNRFTEKVKAGIAKLGTGTNAQVEVKLRDKTRVSGYVSEANESSFVITDATEGTSTVVAYTDVTQAKGNNLSTGKKFAIAAVIVGALAIIYFAVFAGKHL